MPDTVCRAPVFDPAGSVKSGQIAAACHIKTVRGLHAGWGGLVASFAEGMGAPVLRNARVVEDGSFQDAMTSSRRLDGGPAVANAMFSSESACFGIGGLRCVHAVSLPIACFSHRREGAWDRLLP